MQRWPAVPIAANAMARSASARSALGATIARIVAAELQDGAGKAPGEPLADHPAHRRRPGRRDHRHAAIVDQLLGRSRAPPISTLCRPSGASPNFADRARQQRVDRKRGQGVRSDGFQITGLPQTSASAAFHDQTATGKLKAEMTPTGPIGCHCSISRCSARSLTTARP